MALAKSTSGTGTFGRRRTDALQPSRPVSVRNPTASPNPNAEAVAPTIEAVVGQIGTAALRGKAYTRAILSGATTFLAVLFVLVGVESRVFQAGPMLIVLAIPVLPTLALILYIPTVVLSDIARLLSVPRGWADIGIGFVLGAGLGIGIALTSSDAHGIATAIATTAGGLVGGWAFWRAQGYPGTSSGTAAAFDLAYEKIK
jgi:hypothetical protein